MNSFLKRNTLAGGVAILSLLTGIHASASTEVEGHNEHNRHAVEASKTSDGKKATSSSQDASSRTQPMDHGAMDHGSMSHEGMDHESMMNKQGGKAEAGSNHDH
ncbi:hypothetical protein [Stutzerimonas nitrititolerans]|uniref:hypothetical protein n=1 Tax=Stutzerimonas nitrititolerans TaxID=2482751 RepID=UPI0028A9C348|nr:hypothetical protein [Stutzerimonas nitrititolerans]